jgi:hypothetical protein
MSLFIFAALDLDYGRHPLVRRPEREGYAQLVGANVGQVQHVAPKQQPLQMLSTCRG